MTKIIKVYQDDFERVHEILTLFFPNILKETWRQLFIDNWDRPEDFYGYAIIDGHRVVGFIATIFSEREIYGKKYKFCNLSSWVVRNEYRNKSIALIFPILKLTDYTLTIFSAIPEAIKIFKKIGFKVLTKSRKMMAPIPILKSIFFKDCELIYGEDVIKYLDDNELKIYKHHHKFICYHFVMKSDFGNSYLIVRKRKKNIFNFWYPFADIHYISNKEIFMKYFDSVKYFIANKLKVITITIRDTYLPEYQFPYSLNRPAEGFLYRSSLLSPGDIDSLYSEIFILDL
jgi:hypothetical protein